MFDVVAKCTSLLDKQNSKCFSSIASTFDQGFRNFSKKMCLSRAKIFCQSHVCVVAKLTNILLKKQILNVLFAMFFVSHGL